MSFLSYTKQGYRSALCRVPTLLVVRLSTTNIYLIKQQFLSSGRSLRLDIICIFTEKTYATNIPDALCPVRVQHATSAHVYLSKLVAPARAVGCCLFSSRKGGSVSNSYSAPVDDVVGLQEVGTLRYARSSRQLWV